MYKALSEENDGMKCLRTYVILYCYFVTFMVPQMNREPFTSKDNQHVLERVVTEVKTVHPETMSSLIKGVIGTQCGNYLSYMHVIPL